MFIYSVELLQKHETCHFRYIGSMIEVLHDLSLGLNFSYQIVSPEDGEHFGAVDEYGSWSGMER